MTQDLFAWAESRSSAEIVSLDKHRAHSARWRLVIEPRSIDPVESFDRLIGLLPRRPVIDFADIRPRRRA